jgi:hypothetical protein
VHGVLRKVLALWKGELAHASRTELPAPSSAVVAAAGQ